MHTPEAFSGLPLDVSVVALESTCPCFGGWSAKLKLAAFVASLRRAVPGSSLLVLLRVCSCLPIVLYGL